MTREISDLHAQGRLLAGAHSWLAGAFGQVLELLYGEDGDQETLAISPVSLLPNGVLHIRTHGRERFTLEAYLDLQQEAPCLIWQVVTSTNMMGSKPELDGEDWDYLPHLDGSAWRTERDERSAATASFMLDDRERRYAVLYHPPAKWDEARAALSGFFASLLERLRTTNFQQKHTSNAFFSALNER